MKSISAAFVAAQAGFAPALKSSTNPHFKSKYADLSAVVEAVIDALHKNGIGLMQKTHLDESGVTVETVLIHSSGETIECGKLHVPASKQDPQGYGSAMTYARRYSLMAACGIAPEDDDGNAAVKKYTGEDSLVPALQASIEAAKTKTGARAAAAQEVATALTGPQKTALAKLAFEVGDLFAKKGAAPAYDHIKEQGLSSEERTYLWGLMDSSKLRSALEQERMIRGMAAVPPLHDNSHINHMGAI